MKRILIHIGYGKAASSYLQKWFHKNPYICQINSTSEICLNAYFECNNNVERKAYVISDEKLGSWLPHSHSIGCLFDLDFNIKEYQHLVCDKIFDIYKDNAKVLIIKRNKSDIIMSGFSQYLKTGGNLNFEQYICKYKLLIRELYDYNYITKIYQDKFENKNVLLLSYETLKSNPNKFHKLIENFIEIPNFRIENKSENSSLNAKEIVFYPILSKFAGRFFNFFLRKENKVSHNLLTFLYLNPLRKGYFKFLVKFCVTKKSAKFKIQKYYKISETLDH